MITVDQVRFNYERQCVGTTNLPQISWILSDRKRATEQVAYCIQIAHSSDFDHVIYDSTWIMTNQSSQIQLPNSFDIESGRRYFIRVKVRSSHMEESNWSEPLSFVTGILDVEEWASDFISAETIKDKDSSKGTLLRGTFSIDKPIQEAYIFCTAQGLYSSYLNGKKIGNDELTPGWTSYNKRLLYQTYDITDLLNMGHNSLGVLVGAGWYKGKMGFLEERNNYGAQTSYLGQVLIRFQDGTKMIWGTNKEFIAHDAPITFSEIYDGEVYDARLERLEWLSLDENADFTDWRKIEIIPFDKKILCSQPSNRPIVNECIQVKELITTPQGDVVLDFGQNLTGRVEFQVQAEAGEKVVLECFEVLDRDGNVYQDNLRTAKEKITYICKGNGVEIYHPYFTFQGFRYVKITNYPGKVNANNFIAQVIHTELEFTGHFECSNPLLNQLQHNIKWSLKGNFLDVPTDCPQRNERVGWTGDAQIFCRTANFLTNSYVFFSKWLEDVAVDQLPEGGVPHIVPDIVTGKERVSEDWLLSQGTHSAAAWADVAVIAPWTLYLTYGDVKILDRQFNSMKKWIDFMKNHAVDYIWNYKLQFGDWVALDAEEGSYFGATPNELTCTAYFAYSTGLFAKICKVLKKNDLSEEYGKLYEKIKAAYHYHFFTSNGELKVKTQTAHIISLFFELVPEEMQSRVTADLVLLLEKNNGHLVTGFVGTPYFCHALSDNGYVEEAYELLLKEDFPSWLYQIKKGATTIWEHWDGIKEDGSMWSPDMNSFNHYAYGAVGEWLYRKVLGIEIDEKFPGYKRTILQPLVDPHLNFAKGSYDSIHGKIFMEWKYLTSKKVQIHLSIPVNTTALLCLSQCSEILENDEVSFVQEDQQCRGELHSGEYTIIYKQN